MLIALAVPQVINAQTISSCQIQSLTKQSNEDRTKVVEVLQCTDGRAFEVKQISLNDNSCSSSFWCSGIFEHCVNGKCVPKDFFHQCDLFNPCELGDECIDGICR